MFGVKGINSLVTDKVDSNSVEPKGRIEVKKLQALNLSSVISKDELRRQKQREYNRRYYQKNREKCKAQAQEYYWRNRDKLLAEAREYYQKNRDRICAELRERYHSDPVYKEKEQSRLKMRYHSDPEFREKRRASFKSWWAKRREAYERFKKEYGGKCSVCGNNDLDVLVPHHPDGRRGEKYKPFIFSKELTNWIKYGIKPNVVIMCANHHLKLSTAEARGEGDIPES